MTDDSELPEIGSHNEQIQLALDSLEQNRPSFAIIDKGRSADERSCIWIENGTFYGMGYFPTDISYADIADVKNYVSRYSSNQYIMQLIQSFIEKNPRKIHQLQPVDSQF